MGRPLDGCDERSGAKARQQTPALALEACGSDVAACGNAARQPARLAWLRARSERTDWVAAVVMANAGVIGGRVAKGRRRRIANGHDTT